MRKILFLTSCIAMTLGDYNKERGWEIPENENPDREGFYVTYENGHISWLPKEIFDIERELTPGEKAVGLTFNPSGDSKVNEAKTLAAALIDLVEYDHAEKTDNGHKMTSWFRIAFRTQAFNFVISAQTAVVKYLTWRD